MAQNHKFSNYAGFRPFTRTYAIFHLGRRSGHIAAHQTSQSPTNNVENVFEVKEARARVVVRQMREYGFVKKEQFGVYRFVKE